MVDISLTRLARAIGLVVVMTCITVVVVSMIIFSSFILMDSGHTILGLSLLGLFFAASLVVLVASTYQHKH